MPRKPETIRLDSLKINARNPRTITEAAFAKLCESIRRDPEFMRLRPIVTDGEGTVLGGNMRLRACQALGMMEVPAAWVVKASDLTPAQRKRFIVVDNAPEGMAGEFDFSMLAADFEVPELVDLGFTEQMLGIDAPEMQDAEPQIDKAAELNKKWKVKKGDLFAVGNNRLLCGDATKAEDVGRVLGGAVPFLCVTDPPYGVEYDANWRNEVDRANGKPYGARAVGKVTNDDTADWSPAWKLFAGDVAYVWHSGSRASEVEASLECVGLRVRWQIIWGKQQFVIGRGHYHPQHEPCWYCVRDGKDARWIGDHSQTTLWEIDKPHKSETGHSTQKPLECMARPIRNHDAPEVYDPFLGSGTTMVAAQNLGRKCYGIEISPAYCAVILQRMTDAFPGIRIKRLQEKGAPSSGTPFKSPEACPAS